MNRVLKYNGSGYPVIGSTKREFCTCDEGELMYKWALAIKRRLDQSTRAYRGDPEQFSNTLYNARKEKVRNSLGFYAGSVKSAAKD